MRSIKAEIEKRRPEGSVLELDMGAERERRTGLTENLDNQDDVLPSTSGERSEHCAQEGQVGGGSAQEPAGRGTHAKTIDDDVRIARAMSTTLKE